MADYDLRSLKLPKLYGTALSLFTDAVSNPITRPLLIDSLLGNGGIPTLRNRRFEEEPTFFPLEIPAVHAAGVDEMPMVLPEIARTPREQMPFTTIRDFALAYQQDRLSPSDVAENVIHAIEQSRQTSPAMNAFIASDPDDIRRQAQISTENIRKGQKRSLLEGVPVAVKDEIDMLPYPTTVGTTFLGAQKTKKDSRVVARLRDSGAMLVGKTNMHEIGISATGENTHHGRIANPYDLRRDTGGSSNGSGAAVAAGMVPAAIGADGGGSIRIPASLCGVVGLKPTFGRVSEAGAAPLCWSVAHIGPLAASVEDTVLIYQVIAGPDPDEPLSLQQPPLTVDGWNTPDLKGVRLGVYEDWFRHASPEVVKKNEAMLAEFEKAGARVVNITIPELNSMRVAHAVTILSEMAASMQNYQDHWLEFSPSTRLSLVIGQVMSAHDYMQAQRMRTRALQIFAKVLDEVDVILTPTTALSAPIVPAEAYSKGWSDLGTDTEMMRYVFPGNLTGLPAISFPVGYDSNGMPVGMQAMGRAWEEHLLLRVAYNAELRVTRKLPGVYMGYRL